MQKKRGDFHSAKRIHAHYAPECTLAGRLRQAPQAERSSVYSKVHAELFGLLPDHPPIHRSARQRAAQCAPVEAMDLNVVGRKKVRIIKSC
ncbi:MAG: hypothetical protein JO002_07780 [Burkholderiaceae bacterium]|nr:hypothetical protein [Burkholderiaceae bacterium]